MPREHRHPVCAASAALVSARVVLRIILLCLGALASQGAEIAVVAPAPPPPVDFALRKLESALVARGDSLLRQSEETTATALMVQMRAVELGPDGFKLEREGSKLIVTGGDARGTMYGVLDVAAQLQLGTPLRAIAPRTVRAQFGLRGIKFNLPFAGYRNAAYIEQHQATCKDLRFWEAFLDRMAENRFNTLTLWSLHPFQFMVVPKSFPEAQSVSDAELAEFRQLWTGVFRLAKERGIETYLVNWNTFVSPAFADAHGVALYSKGETHIGPGATEKIVEDYMRECVTQTIDEYPDLTGFGITLGERMGGQTPEERRAWLERTFFDGIAAARRPVKFIYRAPLSANTGAGGSTSAENDRATREQIERPRKNVLTPVYVDFKHNASHAHSSPDLFRVHGGTLSDAYWNPPPASYRISWTMRNEDMIVLRWGQPDFVRQFMANNRAPHIGGALIGSETYIPALDFITAEGPHKTGRYAFERQWLFYATWGLLMHEPATPDARFAAMLEARFGGGAGDALLQAWKLASNLPLRFASFYQGTWDGSLYTEGFATWFDFVERKLINIDSFIRRPVLDTKRYVNITDYVKAGGATAPGVMSPLALADLVEDESRAASQIVTDVRAKGGVSPALDAELTDIEAWCAFGNYFAKKLRAGVALETARVNHDPARQQAAVVLLEQAVEDWQRLATLGAKFNRLPILSPAREPFSWDSLTPAVRHDIVLAKAPL